MIKRVGRTLGRASLLGWALAGALVGCGPTAQTGLMVGWPNNIGVGRRASVAPSVRIGGEVGVHLPVAPAPGLTARLSVEHVALDTGGFRLGYGAGGGASLFVAGCADSYPPVCGPVGAGYGDVFVNAELVTAPLDVSLTAGLIAWRFVEPSGWAEQKARGEDVIELFQILPMVRLAIFF